MKAFLQSSPSHVISWSTKNTNFLKTQWRRWLLLLSVMCVVMFVMCCSCFLSLSLWTGCVQLNTASARLSNHDGTIMTNPEGFMKLHCCAHNCDSWALPRINSKWLCMNWISRQFCFLFWVSLKLFFFNNWKGIQFSTCCHAQHSWSIMSHSIKNTHGWQLCHFETIFCVAHRKGRQSTLCVKQMCPPHCPKACAGFKKFQTSTCFWWCVANMPSLHNKPDVSFAWSQLKKFPPSCS